MYRDPIVAQVRAARAAYAASMHHDLAAICADLRHKQAEHPKRVISFQPRPLPDEQRGLVTGRNR